MIDPTDLPTLKARLRELHANGNLGELCVVRCDHEEHDVSWVVQTEFGETVAHILESEDACARHAADLIAETLNALPALLDELDRAESESALCKRFAEQNVEELNADELREYAIGLGERVARNEREMADANGRLRARHAEEVEGLRRERDALREEVEDWEAAAQELSNQLVARTKERDDLLGRSPAFAFARIAELESQLTARRAHDADVRALARWAIETEHMSDHVNTDQIGDVGRNILAVLDSHECPECHMVERCKMSCSRGGSKGARVSVSPREGGE